MAPVEIDRLLDPNLRSCTHLVHAALPHLRRSGGRMVLVGSIAGVVGVPGEARCSVTKAGLAGFAGALLGATEHVRDELAYPGWLTIPTRLHGGLPGLYRTLARRFSPVPPALRSA